jgi:Tetracyclin repressor-like, C-terminal domain
MSPQGAAYLLAASRRINLTSNAQLREGARRVDRRRRFPALADPVASGALEDEDDPGSEFEFGLERILDGVAQLIARS